MDKYNNLINIYEKDEKIVMKYYLSLILAILIINVLLILTFMNYNNVLISIILTMLLCIFFFSQKRDDLIYLFIKKINKKIKTEDILNVFKYGNYRIWGIPDILINDSVVFKPKKNWWDEDEFILLLGYEDIQISKEIFEKIQKVKNENVYIILEEQEYQKMLKTKICNNCIII